MLLIAHAEAHSAALPVSAEELEDHQEEIDDVEVELNGRHDVIVRSQSVVNHPSVCRDSQDT